MNTKLEQLKDLLTKAEASAKGIADENPSNPIAQALRARVLGALEICDHVRLDETPASEETAKALPQ